MEDDWPDAEGYPDAHTRAVLKFYEAASEVKTGDQETLPALRDPTKRNISPMGVAVDRQSRFTPD